jgi:hypothetical protein
MRAGLPEREHALCCRLMAYRPLLPAFRLRSCLLLLGVLSFGILGLDLPDSKVAKAVEPFVSDAASSRETQADACRRIPMQQLSREAQTLVNEVIDKPSFFRRMPTQNIDCDPQMFIHLVRYPEVLVNIWDVMGITKVQVNRTGPYTFTADDGVGTTCKCDLVFGNDKVHVYYGTGAYKGSMAPRQITGRCVCVLYSNTAMSANRPIINGSMDVFLKLDNLGADLLTRTLSPLVGKTADYNFVESAKFLSQISQVCEHNPTGAQILATKLTKIQPQIRDEFARIALRIGCEAADATQPQQIANVLPDGNQFTSNVTRKQIPSQVNLDAAEEISTQLNPQRVPPMTLNSKVIPEAGPASPIQFRARPPSIAPAKPNVYMRR